MDRPGFMTSGVRMLRSQSGMLEAIIARERPVAICSTFPAYAALFKKLGREGRFDTPHFNIVTDSISINSVWWRPGCDGWFVPNEDSAEVMRAAGVDPARLHVAGFPVTPYLPEERGHRDPARPRSAPRRGCSTSSIRTRNAEATARLLLAEGTGKSPAPWAGTSRCQEALAPLARARKRRARDTGLDRQIPELLMTHHVVVSKAGGATTQEAIAARCR